MPMQRLPPRLLRLLLLSSVAFRVDALHGAISRVSSKPQQRPRLWQRASPSLWQRRSSLQAARSEDGALAETQTKPNVVHALILANYATFFADRVLGAWPDKGLYLWHHRWSGGSSSPRASATRIAHLGGNTFLLLLFGRSIEDEVGGLGLVLALLLRRRREPRVARAAAARHREPRRVGRGLRPLRRLRALAARPARPDVDQGRRGRRARRVCVRPRDVRDLDGGRGRRRGNQPRRSPLWGGRRRRVGPPSADVCGGA